MSEEDFKSFLDPLWLSCYKECASEKIIELDATLVSREATHRQMQANDSDPFTRSLREEVQRIFRLNIAKEKIKWATFEKPKYEKGKYDLEALKKIPIESIHPFEKIRDTETRLTALCPFHEEDSPSFVIFKEENHYHCFGCNVHGDIFTFIQEREECSFKDALKYLSAVDKS